VHFADTGAREKIIVEAIAPPVIGMVNMEWSVLASTAEDTGEKYGTDFD
jgi:hypothetical protein